MSRSLAQTLGPPLGIVYIILGIVGFVITGFNDFTQQTDEELLGVGLNPYHNIVHLGAGVFLLIMTTLFSAAVAEGAMMGTGLFLIVAFVIGVSGDAHLSILSIDGPEDIANFLHIATGVALLVIGLLSSAATRTQMKRRGLA